METCGRDSGGVRRPAPIGANETGAERPVAWNSTEAGISVYFAVTSL